MRTFLARLALLATMAIAALALAAATAPAWAGGVVIPAAKIVIYPGDVIQDEMLEDIAAEEAGVGGPFAFSRADLIGKVTRRTLLPGRAIPLQGLDNPRLIRNGSIVKMVYVDGGLQIETDGAALQDGAVGDVIRLRNVDSGIAVEGRVQADGTVLVSGG